MIRPPESLLRTPEEQICSYQRFSHEVLYLYRSQDSTCGNPLTSLFEAVQSSLVCLIKQHEHLKIHGCFTLDLQLNISKVTTRLQLVQTGVFNCSLLLNQSFNDLQTFPTGETADVWTVVIIC